ncbi:MAG: hypothetical protein L0Z49_00245 [Actinobacteria bacterium]|nr:hypothetical protein [Actinomycetota bacterium]MCI0542856.1 hypothetical protein [Actinomycetota bacterium]MCI0679042.1 hypothetical protein [Actinomycetota bacterium]
MSRAALGAILVAAVEIGGGFGAATASTVTLGSTTMVVDIEVEVARTTETVVAHLSIEDEALVIPLLHRGDGIYGVRTEVPRKDHVVVFEILGPNGELSTPITLTQLGADLAVAPDRAPEEEGLDESTTRWGWLGLALGAASLSVLAIWVLVGREENGPEAEEE